MADRSALPDVERTSAAGLHLELQHVVVRYGAFTVLHGVSMEVMPGECVVLIGANGSGKSTVLKTIAGFVRPREGSIRLGGDEIGGLRPHQVLRRGCAYVAQGQDLFPRMSVVENVQMGGFLLGSSRRVDQRVSESMDLFPVLRDKSNLMAGALSGGERQQLKIARALMTSPRVLLLDEPSAGLAPLIVDQVFDDLRAIRRETGITTLLVEQNIAKGLENADRACVLELGVISRAKDVHELAAADAAQELYFGGGGRG